MHRQPVRCLFTAETKVVTTGALCMFRVSTAFQHRSKPRACRAATTCRFALNTGDLLHSPSRGPATAALPASAPARTCSALQTYICAATALRALLCNGVLHLSGRLRLQRPEREEGGEPAGSADVWMDGRHVRRLEDQKEIVPGWVTTDGGWR